MAGDQRTRRLIDDTAPSQRTLDSAPPDPTPPSGPGSPDLLETPGAPEATARLDDRQARWFRLREYAAEKSVDARSPTSKTKGSVVPDPKG